MAPSVAAVLGQEVDEELDWTQELSPDQSMPRSDRNEKAEVLGRERSQRMATGMTVNTEASLSNSVEFSQSNGAVQPKSATFIACYPSEANSYSLETMSTIMSSSNATNFKGSIRSSGRIYQPPVPRSLSSIPGSGLAVSPGPMPINAHSRAAIRQITSQWESIPSVYHGTLGSEASR